MSILWSSLEFITAPLRWIDAKIQRAVDLAMHSVMRRFGWRKSSIRYALWAVGLLSIGGVTIVDNVVKARGFWSKAVVAFFFCCLLAAQHIDRHDDQAAESGKVTKQRPDTDGPSRILWLWLLVRDVLAAAGVMAISKDVAAHPSMIRSYLAFNLTLDVAFILMFYTRRTPPKAPDKAPRTVLVPARSEG